MSKIKNGGLDQYGAGPFEQQQFGTAGVEGVEPLRLGPLGPRPPCLAGSAGVVFNVVR